MGSPRRCGSGPALQCACQKHITYTLPPGSCCCLVAQLCLTLCDPMNCSTPGFPVPHHLPELAQPHVHCIGDAVRPSHPLMPSSPSALNLSQHQGLLQWIVCSHQMTKYWSFRLSIRPSSEYSGLFSLKIDWSPCCPRDFQESSGTTVRRHQLLGVLPSVGPSLTTVHDHSEHHSLDNTDLCWESNVSTLQHAV